MSLQGIRHLHPIGSSRLQSRGRIRSGMVMYLKYEDHLQRFRLCDHALDGRIIVFAVLRPIRQGYTYCIRPRSFHRLHLAVITIAFKPSVCQVSAHHSERLTISVQELVSTDFKAPHLCSRAISG